MNVNTSVKPELAPPLGTDLLCKNLLETTYDRLSEENVRIFRDRLLDITGCMFGGAVVPEDKFLAERLCSWGGVPEAPLFARAGRLPLPTATLLNCITSRANDYGCMFFNVMGDRIASHCGETLIPMNLTLADVYGVSGKEFITSNVAAEDMTGRLLYMLPVRWPADVLVVSTAASALACRYYGLNSKQAKVALSYGATNSTSPGNSYYDYCQEFMYHNGACAQMGIISAELAKGGWRGLEDPLFGRNGIIASQIKDGSIPPKYEEAFEGLGSVYYTEGSFKRGPGGIPTTAAAKCGAALHKRIVGEYGTFQAEHISKVHVFRSKSVNYNYYSEPFRLRNHMNALFSFQFSVCCALIHGWIPLAAVQTPAILADSELIRLSEESTMDTFECEPGRQLIKVTVEMKDGRVLEAVEEYGVSMHEYPSKEVLIAKFWNQFDTFGILSHSVGEKIIELAGKIEELQDMREYTSLLTL